MTEYDIHQAFLTTAHNFEKLTGLAGDVSRAAQIVTDRMRVGGKLMFCGNGGSSADAQHLAAELMGRFMIERSPFAAIALNVNVSTITAISNDYSFEVIFERQLLGIGRPGDVLVAISTSGNSKNILRVLQAAKTLDILTIGFTGETGGKMIDLCDICFRVPSNCTPRIQEMHIALGHALCEWIETALA